MKDLCFLTPSAFGSFPISVFAVRGINHLENPMVPAWMKVGLIQVLTLSMGELVWLNVKKDSLVNHSY